MNPVSFGSVYKIYLVSSDIRNNNQGHSILDEYCKKNNLQTSTKTEKRPKYSLKFGEDEFIFKTTTINAEREQDHSIDMICNNYKIKHDKITPTRTIRRTWSKEEEFYTQLRRCFHCRVN
ncbi:hypothetical protein IJ182_10705 [bacterium]|nr:hypothetical protein [bacterium]